jgi:ABC-type Mn2+/Zn2+ transport system permease subunit
MIPFSNLDAVITGLAISYLITLCANWNVEKRSYSVCMILFVINAALVIASAVKEDAFLCVLWILCLAINGSVLGRKR